MEPAITPLAKAPSASGESASVPVATVPAATNPAATSPAATTSAVTTSAVIVAAASVPAEPGARQSALSSGGFAQGLIQHQIRRLGKLQAQVVADEDPEPLHQLRVSLRRLRTALLQFGPALVLPEGVSERRLAAVARRTSLCRDLDVLRLRFNNQLLPRLPKEERQHLSGTIKRLRRDRAEAFATLLEALRSGRYLKLLERLNRWHKQPRFTPLGELPLLPWLVEWQAPFHAGLFLHPGWREQDPAAAALHGLRKRIKAARYALEIVEPWCDPPLLAWIDDLRQAQEHLGELHDLQILHQNLCDNLKPQQRTGLPVLLAELDAQQLQHWLRWRQLAERLQSDDNRASLQRQLLDLGHGPAAAADAESPGCCPSAAR
jgi:CHAD domain-containing protein